MDPSKVKFVPMMDLSTDNITENVLRVNSNCPDPRLKFIMERLVTHLHDFAREVRLSSKEWMAGLEFLTATGQKCTDVRQEFILLSDTLGLSLLVDAIDHPKPGNSTEGTVLGPFHSHEAEHMPSGETMAHDPSGEPLLVICTLKDQQGNPIEDVQIDIWETDSHGNYDVQYEDRKGPDGRCIMKSDKDGGFWFRAITPVSYPIPDDGTVGNMLRLLNRHAMRPSHMHFMFEKKGWDHLITALYVKNDPYEQSDAVFGVKKALVTELHPCDAETAQKYDFPEGKPVLRHDFVLVSEEESRELRELKSKQALEKLGSKVKFVGGLPIPDVD
ncbi:hypothetical protein MMC25_004005 [Agyrium rufum]|nr:hypothetical protein [Agyrium rufum]